MLRALWRVKRGSSDWRGFSRPAQRETAAFETALSKQTHPHPPGRRFPCQFLRRGDIEFGVVGENLAQTFEAAAREVEKFFGQVFVGFQLQPGFATNCARPMGRKIHAPFRLRRQGRRGPALVGATGIEPVTPPV